MKHEPTLNIRLCHRFNKTFYAYVQQRVIWSGDTLPSCPHCDSTIYDNDHAMFHTFIKQDIDD